MSQTNSPNAQTLDAPFLNGPFARSEVAIGEAIPLSVATWKQLVRLNGPSVSLTYAGAVAGIDGGRVMIVTVETNGRAQTLYLPLGSLPSAIQLRGAILTVYAVTDSGKLIVIGTDDEKPAAA